MDFSLRSIKNQQSLIDQLRTKKHVKSMSCAPEHMIQSCDTDDNMGKRVIIVLEISFYSYRKSLARKLLLL